MRNRLGTIRLGTFSYQSYEYKGYKYEPEEEAEEDVVKTHHVVICPDGRRTHLPWSPYRMPSKKYFCLWIDAGLPTHPSSTKGNRCLTKDELVGLVLERHMVLE